MSMTVKIEYTDISHLIAFRSLKWNRKDKKQTLETLDGKTHAVRTAYKAVFSVMLLPLTYDELCSVQSIIEPVAVSVEYDDPLYGRRKVRMLVAEDSANLLTVRRDGTEYWENLSLSFEEL